MVLLLSLRNYNSRNFKINIDHYKIYDKVMRVGSVISPCPLRDASSVSGSCVCVRECVCLWLQQKGWCMLCVSQGLVAPSSVPLALVGQGVKTNLSVSVWAPNFFLLVCQCKYTLWGDIRAVLHNYNDREHQGTCISLITFAESVQGGCSLFKDWKQCQTVRWCMLTLGHKAFHIGVIRIQCSYNLLELTFRPVTSEWKFKTAFVKFDQSGEVRWTKHTSEQAIWRREANPPVTLQWPPDSSQCCSTVS